MSNRQQKHINRMRRQAGKPSWFDSLRFTVPGETAIVIPPEPPSDHVFWVAADKETAYSHGDDVTVMNDYGSYGANLVHDTPGEYPTFSTSSILNAPSISFDGTGNRLYTTSSFSMGPGTQMLIAMVVKDNTGTSTRIVHDGAQGVLNSSRVATYKRSGNWTLYAGTIRESVASVEADEWTMILGYYDEAASVLRKDGVEVMSGSDPGSQTLLGGIGFGDTPAGGAPWGGELAEVLIYTGSTAYDQIADVETYLESKYGSFPQT